MKKLEYKLKMYIDSVLIEIIDAFDDFLTPSDKQNEIKFVRKVGSK